MRQDALFYFHAAERALVFPIITVEEDSVRIDGYGAIAVQTLREWGWKTTEDSLARCLPYYDTPRIAVTGHLPPGSLAASILRGSR